MKEIWRDIKDYEGLYQVSNLGRVRSVDRYVNYKNIKNKKRLMKGKILKPTINRWGYYLVCLNNINRKWVSVHRLVAQTFLPNPDNLPQVNHIDENKTNNCVDNLEWCSVQYNNTYGDRIKKAVKKTNKPVEQYTKDGQFVKEYPSAIEAERQTGISSANICTCCKGRLKTAGGYIWKYKNLIKI